MNGPRFSPEVPDFKRFWSPRPHGPGAPWDPGDLGRLRRVTLGDGVAVGINLRGPVIRASRQLLHGVVIRSDEPEVGDKCSLGRFHQRTQFEQDRLFSSLRNKEGEKSKPQNFTDP